MAADNAQFDFATWLDQTLAKGDVRVRDWPLMDVRVVLVVMVAYLVGIFVLVKYMKTRAAFELKWIPLFHNIHLCLLSLYMMVEVLRQAYIGGYSLFGNGVDKTEAGYGMARAIWIFYVSKVAEFGDTIIMALKKNFHQISFLHLYHHASIFFVWWVVCYFAPGGESYFSAALNSFIHVLMYGYYFWSTVHGWSESPEAKAAKKKAAAAAKAAKESGTAAPVAPEPKKRLSPCEPAFYRQYITSMQMLQFTVMFIQANYNVIVDIPGYPKFLGWVLFFYMLTMLGLFANFFRAQYLSAGKAKAAKKKALAAATAAEAATEAAGKPKEL